MLYRSRVRIIPMIAVAGLLAGCQKSQTFPPNGDVTPVNESAMPAPEPSTSATDSEPDQSPSPPPAPAATGT